MNHCFPWLRALPTLAFSWFLKLSERMGLISGTHTYPICLEHSSPRCSDGFSVYRGLSTNVNSLERPFSNQSNESSSSVTFSTHGALYYLPATPHYLKWLTTDLFVYLAISPCTVMQARQDKDAWLYLDCLVYPVPPMRLVIYKDLTTVSWFNEQISFLSLFCVFSCSL